MKVIWGTCIAGKVVVVTDVPKDWIPKEQSIIFNTDVVSLMVGFFVRIAGVQVWLWSGDCQEPLC